MIRNMTPQEEASYSKWRNIIPVGGHVVSAGRINTTVARKTVKDGKILSYFTREKTSWLIFFVNFSDIHIFILNFKV